MTTKHLLKRRVKKHLSRKQDRLPSYPGTLGDGFGNLAVSGRPGYVYVRVNGAIEQAFNNRVPAAENEMLVTVGYDVTQPGLYQILETRSGRPSGASGTTPATITAKRFQWFAEGGGQDPLFVELRQFLPLRIGPSSGMELQVYRGFVQIAPDTFFRVPTQTVDLSAHIPASADQAAFVLITVDDTGAIVDTKGAEVDVDLLDYTTDIPAKPLGTVKTLGAVRVYTGQEEIQEARTNTDIVDLRFTDGSGGGSAGTVGPNEIAYGDAAGAIISEPAFTYVEADNVIWVGGTPIAGFTGTAGLNAIGDGVTARLRAFTFGSAFTPGLTTYHAGGTQASPTQSTSGMVLGRWSAGGWDNAPAATATQVEIRANATEDWTTSARGSSWSFYTTPAGSTTLTLTATLSMDGGLVLPVSETITVATASKVGLTLKTSDDNTTNPLMQILSSADAVIGGWGALGHIGVGITPNVLYPVYVSRTFTDPTAFQIGLNGVLVISAGAAAITQPQRGLNVTIQAEGSGGASGSGSLGGLVAEALSNQTAGSIVGATAGSFAVRNLNAGAIASAFGLRNILIVTGTGSITTGIDFNARAPSLAGVGGITTHYGFYAENLGSSKQTSSYAFYAENQSGSVTNNYAIFTNTGLVRFGDATTITPAFATGTATNAGLTVNPTQSVVNSSGDFYAISASATMSATSGSQGNIYGLSATAVLAAAATITATTVAGGVYQARNLSTAGGIITNAYGVLIVAPTATGVITNAYGLFIQDITQGGTNFAMRTNSGIHSYLGSLTFASAAGASWNGITFRNATATITGSTNITNATGVNYITILQPTLSAASALTITNAATLYIANAPAGGGAGPATITNAYSVWVDSGNVRVDDSIIVGTTSASAGAKIFALQTYAAEPGFSGRSFYSQIVVNSATSVTSDVSAMYALAQQQGAGTASNIIGISAVASIAAGSGVVSLLRGLFVNIGITSGAGGTITDGRGISIAPAALVAGAITTLYGLYIDDQTTGATSYSIFTKAGKHSYLGSATIASAASATWNAIEYRAATATISGSTNITTAAGFNYINVAQPTLSAASALTVTNAATLYIANAPAGGGAGPATITNAFAIWADAGVVRFDGGAIFNEDGTATVDFRIESDTEANFFFIDANGSTDGELYMGGTTNGIKVEKGGVLSFIGTAKVKDATNIPFDTTTGSKIGTAASQKIGFWNATPIVQPTTAVAAATFVANTSGIVDDSATFDGYTIGQVVKALRNAGLLA